MKIITVVFTLIGILVIPNVPSFAKPEGVVRVYVYNDADNIIDKYGSGTVISSTQVLTNWHVVKDCRDQLPIKLRFSNGARCVASIVHTNKIWDMALLEFNHIEGCQPFIFGKRLRSKMLATIHGVGPDYEYRAQTGVVGNIFYYPNGLTVRDGDFFIVRNTLARGGDSGGPITDINGKLIGVLHARSLGEGFTKGITIDRIKNIFGPKIRDNNDD